MCSSASAPQSSPILPGPSRRFTVVVVTLGSRGPPSLRASSPHPPPVFFCFLTGKPRVELTFDKMYTVSSRLIFTVHREDDGVPVVCIVDHPAVKDFQAQKFLEVQCEYLLHLLRIDGSPLPPDSPVDIQTRSSTSCPLPVHFLSTSCPPSHPFMCFFFPDKPEVKILVEFPQGLTREGENLELTCRAKGKPQYDTHTHTHTLFS